jgi:ADP-heptose:LPS heptosyltransferase
MRRIGEIAGLEQGEYKASLMLSADSIKWFREKYAYPRPYIFINLSATGADRRWPGENWARYLHGCGLQNETMLINGVPEDREMASQLCAHFPNATIFRPRQFMDVAAAIMDARLVLTPDTGVVHAASALNKPIVALYCGGTDLNRNGPLSDRKLIIQAQGSLCEFPSEPAIRQTLQHGLP